MGINFKGNRINSLAEAWGWRGLGWALFLLALPNAVVYILAHLQGLDRPYINVDYALVLLCLALGVRFLAAIILCFVFFFDVLGLVGQVIPILRLSDVIYISSFIGIAPLSYQLIGAALVGLLIFFMILYLNKKNQAMRVEFLLCINLVVAAYLFTTLSTDADKGQVWNRQTPSPLGSQTVFAFNSRKTGFVQSLYIEQDLFGEVSVPGAASLWFGSNSKLSDKMLLVLNESWGVTKEGVQRAILKPILAMENDLDNIERGMVSFQGITVEAEIRELCQSDLMHFNFEEHQSELLKCLPNQLKKKGYNTFAFHGAAGLMYDRVRWYPDIGFEKSTFFESQPWPRRCFSFPGACDSDMAGYVASSFEGSNKVFSYWLTLNSHYSYDARDIHREIPLCRNIGVEESSEVCRNLSLQRQFFEDLAEIVRRPEMAGVTVLVVGDHEPPITNKEEKLKYFTAGKVPWVRFKVPLEKNYMQVSEFYL